MIKYTKEYCKENKVAIGCDTGEEVKQLAKIFGDDRNNKGYWYYHYNRENYLHYYCPYTMSHGNYGMYNDYNVPCITFKQFIKDNTEETLPERWCVEWNEEIGKFYDSICKAYCYTEGWGHLSSHNSSDVYILDANSLTGRSFSGKRGKEITQEQFKRLILKQQENTMERKIIAYELLKDLPNLKKGHKFIWNFEIKRWDSDINDEDGYNYKEEEIKDTEWFKPVYEEEYKVGDFVSFYTNDKQIYTSKIKEWTSSSYCKLENGLEPFKHLIRKATPEEIQNATERYVTLSNGKEVRINKEGVLAEGRLIPVNSLESLLKPFLSTVVGWTTELIDATYKIGCWENITKADIQKIIDNYNEIEIC
jgi:hypothetical protein